MAKHVTNNGCAGCVLVGVLVVGGIVLVAQRVPNSPTPAAPVMPRAAAPPAAALPAYRVASSKDVKLGRAQGAEAIGVQVRVSLPAHYPQATVEQIARQIAAAESRKRPVNAVTVLFFGPGASTTGAYDVAAVEWAPNGRWADANTVKAGDYATFRYSTGYNPPVAVPATPPARATKPGLLGAPLPKGARLTKKVAANSDRDAREEYTVKATAAAIAAFFAAEMAAAGWGRDGVQKPTFLYFRKGSHKLGVIIDSDGGSFTLMGS
jgi:hypothetical protein